jgi:hypothetical protein
MCFFWALTYIFARLREARGSGFLKFSFGGARHASRFGYCLLADRVFNHPL